jgi:hypothetical protein
VIENPGNFLLGPSEVEGHRQTIQSIEYTIRTSMPGQISLPTLVQFAEEIVAAIEYLYRSNELGANTRSVIRSLEDTKAPLQEAIDAARPGGNNGIRYRKIPVVRRKLEEALDNW